MNPKKTTRNKMIVILREVGEMTKDKDLSVRKIGRELGVKEGVMARTYKRDKKLYTIEKYLKKGKSYPHKKA